MEVSSITGHSNLKMLKRYTHIKPESLVARLDRVRVRSIRCMPRLLWESHRLRQALNLT